MAAAPEVENVPLSALKADPLNPRQMSQHDAEALKRSLQEFGAVVPAVVNKDGVLIGGHMRVEAARALGWEAYPVIRVSLTKKKARLLNLALNRISGDWDEDKLAEMIYGLEEGGAPLELSGFGEEELTSLLDSVSGEEPEPPGPSLRDRFVVPPFSVLDKRHPDWQEREHRWLALGIQSEIGREGEGVMSTASGFDPEFYRLKEEAEKRLHRQLSTAEFLAKHWDDSRGGNLNALPTGGTSIFSPVLCELAYRWFSPHGAHVLDPFAGGSVRGILAAMLERRYRGIELSGQQVEANRAQAKEIVPKDRPAPAWEQGPAQKLAELLPKRERYDFLFSCPPYFALEKYTEEPEDLSRMSPEEFVRDYREIVAACVERLRDDRFACFVVGDARDKGGRQLSLVAETIRAFEDAGAQHHNHAILVTPTASAAMRASGLFSKRRYLTRCHQHVLVFCKGSPTKATEACGPVELILGGNGASPGG